MRHILTPEHKEHARSLGVEEVPDNLLVPEDEMEHYRRAWRQTSKIMASVANGRPLSEQEIGKRCVGHAVSVHDVKKAKLKADAEPKVIYPRIPNYKNELVWIIRILALIFLALVVLCFVPHAHAQFTKTSIQFQQNGSNVAGGFFNYPFTFNCTTNVTCTVTGTVLSLSATGGGGGGGTVTNFSVVNDTNIQGSVLNPTTTPQLTFSWAGTLAKNRTLATTVYTDQANTFGAFLQTFKAGADFSLTDTTDTTKIVQFSLANITTGNTRQINIPDANSTTAQTNTCTNQVFTSMNGQGVFVCSTVSNAMLASSNLTLNTAAPLTGGGTVSLGGTLSLSLTKQNLLNTALFNDVTAAAVSRGAGIFGIGGSPAWALVVAPGTNGYFKANSLGDIVASSGAASGTGACTAHNWTSTLNADAAPTCTQPAFTDISGTATNTQLPSNPLLNTSTCSDCAAGTPTRGDIVTVPSSGKWTRFALPSSNSIYQSNATDVIASTAIIPSKINSAVYCDQTIASTGYASLNLAYAAAPQPGTIIVTGSCPLTANLNMDRSVELSFVSGGSVSIPTSTTLTINGAVDAPPRQIFVLTGSGLVVFGNGASVGNGLGVYPEWWGAKCDTVADDTTGFQAAVAAVSTPTQTSNFRNGGTIIIPPNVQCQVSSLNLDNTIGLTIRVGLSGGMTPDAVTSLNFTGTCNPAACLSMRSVSSLTFWGIVFSFPNATQTVTPGLIDMEHCTGANPPCGGGDTNNVEFHHCIINGPSGSVGPLVFADQVDFVSFDNWTEFENGNIQVQGPTSTSHFSDHVIFNQVSFALPGTAAIANPSVAWEVHDSELLQSNGATCAPWVIFNNSQFQVSQFKLDQSEALESSNCTNTYDLLAFPAVTQSGGVQGGIQITNNLLIGGTGANHANQRLLNIGNNQALIATGNLVDQWGTVLLVGTGVTANVFSNVYPSGTVGTFLSGTPSTGCIEDISGNRTCYGPLKMQFPDVKTIPAANCNNTTAGPGWSITSGGTVTCRAGTNNLGGFIAITDTSTTFAQFAVTVPEDWNSAINPFIRFQIASTDTTSGHTIIPQIKVSCAKGDGSTTDDVTFNAAHSLSTITTNTTANQFWSTANVQLNSTDMTGCVAGSLMIVQVGRATDTSTNARFYSATMTFPRNTVSQAN
jgi:hypothetical protein